MVDPRGYVLIRVGTGAPLADIRGYAYEHRLKAEKAIGRRLKPGEVVRRKRGYLQKLRDADLRISCSCGCGEIFLKYDRWKRERSFISGHNLRGI